jgi:alpha-2-macroglobulin
MSTVSKIRQWLKDWRNITILVQAILLLSVGVALAAAYLPGAFAPDGERVEVVDVVLDRDQLNSVEFFFDRPLGEGRVGESFGEDPATIEPRIGGVWRWDGANVLRFEVSGRFALATEYTVEFDPDRLLGPEQFLAEREFELVTDQFQVERLDVEQETLVDQKQNVVLRGQIRFNYPVSPKELAKQFYFTDPAGSGDNYFTLETTYQGRIIGFRSDPLTKQKGSRELRLVVKSDLSPANGNVTLVSDYVKTVALGSKDQLTVFGSKPVSRSKDSTLEIRLSSPVQPEIAEKFISVEPDVDYRLTATQHTITLTGGFRPGENYKLTVAQGLPGVDGAVLGKQSQRDVHFPDLEPVLDFAHQGEFLSSRGARKIAVKTVNVDRAAFAIDRVYLNNLFPLFRFHGYSTTRSRYYRSNIPHGLGDRIAEEEIRPAAGRNDVASSIIDLSEHVDSEEKGLYRISLMRPGSYQGVQRWLLLTDLGIVAKKSGSEFLIWVSSFSTLASVANARVQLVSNQNQTIASGRTDASGLWRIADLDQLTEKHTPYLITVRQGDDFSFLLFDRHEIGTTGLDISGSSTAGSGYQAYLYGERNIYRPGESVQGLAMLRGRSLRTPPAMPVLFRHIDPQGQRRGTFKQETDGEGTCEFEIELPGHARTGRHRLELVVAEQVVGNYTFQVEEFVPDRIKVDVRPESDSVLPIESIEYRVAADYLFGAPAAGLDVTTRVLLRPSAFSPEGFAGFTFYNSNRKFDLREIHSSQDLLDGDGKQSFAVDLPEGLKAPSSLEAVITARVQEQGGRGVTAVRTMPVHPYPYYVGLRRVAEGYATPNTPVEFEYVTVSPDGGTLESGGLQAEFFHDVWNTVLRRTRSGSYRYESNREAVLVDVQALPAGEASGSVSFTPPSYGSYRVVISARDTGASSQIKFYAGGWGDAPWAIENPARVELDLDKTEYELGGTAMVQVKAPFKGKLWLTVEQEKVHFSRMVTLTGNTAQIPVPIGRELRPNAYVTATIVRSARDLSADQPARAFGAIPLSVDRLPHRLDLEVDVPDEIRPLTEVELRIKTQPGAAVTIAAVDEGILQLIAQRTPDPFSHFYQKRALKMRSYDTYALLMPEVEGESQAGGGAGADLLSQFVQTSGIRRVKPVAFWSGIIKADSQGSAQIRFDVPEFQGSLRVMAVAHKGADFGSTHRSLRVRDKVVLLPTFPRVLSFREEVDIPVTVRNDTGSRGEFRVDLETDGPATVVGEAFRTIELDNESEDTVYFNLRIGDETGALRMNLSAAGNQESTRASAEVPVRPDLPASTVETAGQLSEGSTELPPEDADAFRPGTAVRTLRVSPLPLVQFSGKLRSLLRYPYGCLEQTTSRAFPLIYFSDLAKELDPELFAETNPDDYVRTGIRRLGTMQLNSGGFAMWPYGTMVYPWGSAYATHFLVEARRAGHTVPAYIYDGALRFLENEVRAEETYSRTALDRIVYSLYVLARADRPDVSTMNYIRRRHLDSLRPHTRALLGAAFASTGDTTVFDELVRQVEAVEKVERQTGRNLDSAVRNRALLLLAFLDSAPQDERIAVLVDRLARDREAVRYWNTQETSFALLALGQFVRRQTAQAEYSGKVYVQDRLLGSFGNETKVFSTVPPNEPVRIEVEGESVSVFYHLTTRGIPTDQAFRPEQEGIEVERELLTREGDFISPDEIKQGDLIVIRGRVRSVAGTIRNVVVQNLLPSGLEVENPRLKSTETLPWMIGKNQDPAFLDLRDDRVLLFMDLPAQDWRTFYTLVRAVTPGTFRLPPIQVEAMYNPALRARGERGTLKVSVR